MRGSGGTAGHWWWSCHKLHCSAIRWQSRQQTFGHFVVLGAVGKICWQFWNHLLVVSMMISVNMMMLDNRHSLHRGRVRNAASVEPGLCLDSRHSLMVWQVRVAQSCWHALLGGRKGPRLKRPELPGGHLRSRCSHHGRLPVLDHNASGYRSPLLLLLKSTAAYEARKFATSSCLLEFARQHRAQLLSSHRILIPAPPSQLSHTHLRRRSLQWRPEVNLDDRRLKLNGEGCPIGKGCLVPSWRWRGQRRRAARHGLRRGGDTGRRRRARPHGRPGLAKSCVKVSPACRSNVLKRPQGPRPPTSHARWLQLQWGRLQLQWGRCRGNNLRRL